MSAPSPASRLRFRTTLASSAAIALLAVALILVRNELDRLIGEVLSVDGHAHSLGAVTGIGAATQAGAWAAWDSASDAASAHSFIAISLAFDLLFVGCYLVLGVRLIHHASSVWDRPVSIPKAVVPLVVVAGLNTIRDILGFVLDFSHRAAESGLTGVFAFLAYATIVASVVLGLQLLLGEVIGSVVRRTLSIGVRAIYAQRLTAIVVIAVAALSLLPLPNLFEQVADVYRGWVNFPTTEGFLPVFTGSTIATLILDFVAFALTGLSLFVLGRERAIHYAKLGQVDDREPGRARYWFFFAGGIALVALIIGIATDWTSIDLWTMGIFLVAVVAVPGISALIASSVGGEVTSRPFLGPNLRLTESHVRQAGDLLVAVWIAVWVLGPFKALLSPLFLAVTGEFAHSRFANSFWALLGFEIILIIVGVGAPVALRLLLARFASRIDGEPSQTQVKALRTVAIVAVSLSGAAVVALLLFPTAIAPLFGPVGTLVLLIGCWVTLIGMVVVVFGLRKPLPLFQVLKLRSTPVVTLLIVVPLVISFIDASSTLHAVRTTTGRTLASRLTVSQAFEAWNRTQAACSTELSNGISIRPLILFAAEGGGIRAATWTVDVLRTLPADPREGSPKSTENSCAAGATFISSGASGGSIGLATFQHKGNLVKSPQDQTTLAIGGPTALASDVAGLLDGDVVGGVTGVRVPSPSDLTNPFAAPWSWHDRTALQELTWQSEDPQFAQPYSVTADAPTGYLILNSEDAVTNCKVIVSQLNLRATSDDSSGSANCNGPGAELSNTIDLEDYIGPHCMADLDWSTAAELSARFPVVSPPGRISASTLTNCLSKSRKNLQSLQLVDGGIADNSAIGTMSDLSPELTTTISRYNATATGSSTSPFVVPLVIYASNDPGLDLTTVPEKTKPDTLAPISAIQDAQSALTSPSAWLTRIANGLSQVCVGYAAVHHGSSTCTQAVTQTRDLVPQGVVVASPSTQPAVSEPLGWALSGFARTKLRLEALEQAECGSRFSTIDAECRADRGYGNLGSLLDLFRYPVQYPAGV